MNQFLSKTATLAIVVMAFAGAINAQSQTQMALPAHVSPFTGNVRGYWFTAPIDFTITGLRVPTDASAGAQSIELVRFQAVPPTFSATTNAFTSLFRVVNDATTNILPCHIPVATGDIIGILGCRGIVNSYAPSPAATTIGGVAVTLTRLGMQFQLPTTPAQDLWTEAASSISRVEMYYDLPDDPELDVYESGNSIGSNIAYAIGDMPSGSATNVTFTVDNPSATTALNVTAISAASSGVGNVTVTPSPTLAPASPVSAGGSATFVVGVTPTANGAFQFTVTITNDDPDEGTFSVVVTGTGVTAPEISIARNGTTAVADAGTDNVDIVLAGANLSYTIFNVGNAALNLTGGTIVVVAAGTNVTSVNVTTVPTTPVAASGSTIFIVNVVPTASGMAYDFTISIDNDDSNENPFNFTVTGNVLTNTLPVITAASAISVGQGQSTSGTVATVSDAEDAAGTLTVTATVVPAGLTVTSISNTAGTISATVSATSGMVIGSYMITFQVLDSATGTSTADLTVNVTAPTGGGGGGGGGDDGGCSTDSNGSGWMLLAGLLASLVVAVRMTRARA